MSPFQDLTEYANRTGSVNVGSPSETEFVHSQGDIVRVIQLPELPAMNPEELAGSFHQEIRLGAYGADITAAGLPDGWDSNEATFIVACGGSYLSTVTLKCTLNENNASPIVLPEEAHKIFAQPIKCTKDGNWYCANPITAGVNNVVVYRPMVFPTGCPFDMNLVVEETSQSFVAVQKHTSCDTNGLGNGVFERYSTILVDDDDAGLWAYYGQDADFSLRASAKSDKSFYTLYDSSSSSYYEALVTATQSSLWGYAEDGDTNYKLTSTSSKADLQLWSSSGPTISAWATGSDAGVKVEDGDNYSFLDIGQLWMNLAGAEFHGYGGGLYIKNTDGVWVDIQPPEDNCYFQTVLLGDMTNRWVLCSDDLGGSLDCANLPNPKVGNIEAFQVKTPSYCGPFSTTTVLDLTNTKLTYTGASDSAVYKLDGVYIDSSGDGSYLDKSTLSIWSNSGATGEISVSGTFGGVFRTDNGSGKNANYSATGVEILETNGDSTSLNTTGLQVLAGGGSQGKVWAGGVYINDGSNWVDITPPGGKNAYFQTVLLGDMTNRWVLCSDDLGGSLDCANLPNPKVGNIEAMEVATPSYCGPFSTYTVLDLTSAKLTYTGGSDSAVYKLDGVYIDSSGDGSYLDKSTLYIWDSLGVSAKLSTNSGSGTLDVVNSLGGKGYYAATLATLEDSNGTATLSTQSIFIEKTGGSYAALNGSGWLQLRDSQGKEVYLDPTKIVFSEDSFTATHDAYGFVAQNSGEEGRLNSSSLSLFNNSGSADLSISELTFVEGSDSANYKISGVYIDSSGDGSYLDKSTLSIWSNSGATGEISVSGTFGGVFRTDTGSGKNANYSATGVEILQNNGETTSLNTTGLQVIASGGSQGKIWAGGVYVNDGGNYVNITPPGKDAYFQSVSFCVNGTTKTAMVLMTTPE